MINKTSIYLSTCYDPYVNLATEEWLFENAAHDEMIMYLWQNENTVVIGKNQNIWAECNLNSTNENTCRIARRMSGGGAVFHDLGNLNFTFICSAENYDLNKNMQIIKKACNLAGINAEISGRNDILAEGKKFSGNAFYNSNGRTFHHGTIMINIDKSKLASILTPPKTKLEAKGVKSVKSRVINLNELNPDLDTDTMKKHMITAFKDEFKKDVPIFDVEINHEIEELAKKYAGHEFIYNSQPPFTYCCENRFDWGNISINMNVSKGVINEVKIYTDSMDWSLAEDIKNSLTNCPFDMTSIKNQLPEHIRDDISWLIGQIF